MSNSQLHALRRELWRNTRKMPGQSGYYSKPDSQGMITTGFGRHRDSEPLERANFEAAKMTLEDWGVKIQVLSFGHWAVGWTESLFVPATIKATAKVAELKRRMDSYPVLDDDLLSEEEENDGGLCSNCGESGHHDCSSCQGYLSTFEPYEDNLGHEVCFNCGESKGDHKVKKTLLAGFIPQGYTVMKFPNRDASGFRAGIRAYSMNCEYAKG